jgi:eukaryotic-like serine/threonine-protein kinase
LEESLVPIRERRPDIPKDLANVIEKCLARDPEERYPDAASMRRVLEPFC